MKLENPPAVDATSLRRPPQVGRPEPLFRSFWMGGFESATHITHIDAERQRVDMIAGVQHDLQAEDDYKLLKTVHMHAARDAVRWHLIDRGGSQYDWSSFAPMFEAARRQRIQIIWDVCHYGWPDGVDVFSPEFIRRFARFSGALARYIHERTDEVPFFSPVNEINFLAWGAARFIHPFAPGRDGELKRVFARAAIACVEAIRDVDPRARFVFPEPAIHAMAPRDKPEVASVARQHHESQFEAWDMIAGFRDSDLGGKPEYLDIMGANFYHDNQWEVEGKGHLSWFQEPRDDRWEPLHRLLGAIYRRYRKPLFIAETSHFGEGRGAWIEEIGAEVIAAHRAGTPVEGICLYPIIDRYDWHNSNHWHNSGLWDYHHSADGKLVRILNQDYASALHRTQQRLLSAGIS